MADKPPDPAKRSGSWQGRVVGLTSKKSNTWSVPESTQTQNARRCPSPDPRLTPATSREGVQVRAVKTRPSVWSCTWGGAYVLWQLLESHSWGERVPQAVPVLGALWRAGALRPLSQGSKSPLCSPSLRTAPGSQPEFVSSSLR